MTPEELGLVFQVEDHESVPEYQVVTIHHRRQRRSADRGHTHQVRNPLEQAYNRIMLNGRVM